MTYEFEFLIIWPPQFDIHKFDYWRVEDCGSLVGAVQVGWISEEVFNNNFLPRQRYCENVPCYILLCFFSLNLDVLLHCVSLNDRHTGPEFFAGYDDRPFLLSK